MKRTILITALLLWSIPASAADKWTQVKSRNFTLAGNATENDIRAVAEDLEVFRTAFSRFFNLKEGSSVATTVIVFRSDEAFKPFKPLYKGKPGNVAGYFQQGQDMNFIALAADMETPRVIYHELVHRLMADNMGSFPPWFQEGFAECFSSVKIIGKDKKVQLGQALAEHVELLNQRQFMPLDKLFAVVQGSAEYNEADKQSLFYAESWAFVHYMMFNTPERRAQFMTFLNELGSGAPAPVVFQRVFNTDLESFQKLFEAYIQQRMAWNAFEMNTAGGLDRTKDMTVRTLSEAESEFYLGDLLLHTNRLPDAETHLAKAIKLDPKLAVAQASMGRLLMENKKDTEALGYFQRATELDPGNYLTHYYYAALLDGDNHRNGTLSDADWTTMRAELKKSIELAPQFIEATEMLASNNLSRNTDISETVELLANALKVAPGEDYIAVQLAFALSRTQHREAALPLLRNLLAKSTIEASIRKNAQELFEFLDRAAVPDSGSRVLSNRQNPALPVIVGTSTVKGLMTNLDCAGTVSIEVVSDGKVLKFSGAAASKVAFLNGPNPDGTVDCGPIPAPGIPVAVIYFPSKSGNDTGDPIVVQFQK